MTLNLSILHNNLGTYVVTYPHFRRSALGKSQIYTYLNRNIQAQIEFYSRFLDVS